MGDFPKVEVHPLFEIEMGESGSYEEAAEAAEVVELGRMASE